jgi:hypothetical protein
VSGAFRTEHYRSIGPQTAHVEIGVPVSTARTEKLGWVDRLALPIVTGQEKVPLSLRTSASVEFPETPVLSEE